MKSQLLPSLRTAQADAEQLAELLADQQTEQLTELQAAQLSAEMAPELPAARLRALLAELAQGLHVLPVRHGRRCHFALVELAEGKVALRSRVLTGLWLVSAEAGHEELAAVRHVLLQELVERGQQPESLLGVLLQRGSVDLHHQLEHVRGHLELP